jgi:hypothetical protein
MTVRADRRAVPLPLTSRITTASTTATLPTIHKAQGMTVDRTHVLTTPGMDSHGSYVAMSRHRDGMGPALWPRRLRQSGQAHQHTCRANRAKDMASDYEPPQS